MPTLDLDTGVALHYLRGGRSGGSRPTVVFVNGLTMDTRSWEPLEARLGARYPTLRYDCRGQGLSGAPAGPYRPEQHAADLAALLDALALDPIHLVGLSNGGLVAMLLAGSAASSSPTRVRSLTAIDSLARVDAQLRVILRSWKASLVAGGSALRFDVATPWVWGHAYLEDHLDDVLAFRDLAAAAEPAVIGRLIDGVLDFGDARASLAAYSGPLLALVGEDDLLTPPRYSREIVAWAQRGRLVVLEGAGHASPVERPDEVARVVRGFLEEHDGPTSTAPGDGVGRDG